MNIFEDNDAINAFLNQLANDGMVEPMAEPIDASDCHPLDWAEVVGVADEIFDEMYPEPVEAIDSDGNPWYLI